MPKSLCNRFRPDSVAEFCHASVSRFWDGIELEMRGRRLAAVYLWGYAAEMSLKAAYFDFLGFRTRQTIAYSDLWAAVARAKVLGIPWSKQHSLHWLEGWAELLVVERLQQGRPLAPSFSSKLLSVTRRIYSHWRESMRYHDNQLYPFEVGSVYSAVEWLIANQATLSG